MNEDFLKYGVIKSDLPDKALLELAAVIDREAEFRSKHGNIEYRKYWYEEMESDHQGEPECSPAIRSAQSASCASRKSWTSRQPSAGTDGWSGRRRRPRQ